MFKKLPTAQEAADMVEGSLEGQLENVEENILRSINTNLRECRLAYRIKATVKRELLRLGYQVHVDMDSETTTINW